MNVPTSSDDFQRLRSGDRETQDDATRPAIPPPTFGATRTAITKQITTYPGSLNVFYACETVVLTGDEVEGGAVTETLMGDTFYAMCRGPAVPPVGSKVQCRFTPYRWSFRYGAT